MKSPAFQFYPNDFLGSGSVAAMTLEEVGAYVLLLCYEWNEGGLPDDMDRLARWCRVSRRKFDGIWRGISENFTQDVDGRWKNPRLEVEREKQEEYREKMAANGRRGGRPKKPQESDGIAAANQQVSTEKADGKPTKSTPSPTPSSTSVTTTTSAARPRADKSAPWMGGVRDAVTSAFDGAFPKEKLWAKALRPKYGTLPDEDFFAEIAAYCEGVGEPQFVNPTLCAECMGTWRQRRAEKVLPMRRAVNDTPRVTTEIDW